MVQARAAIASRLSVADMVWSPVANPDLALAITAKRRLRFRRPVGRDAMRRRSRCGMAGWPTQPYRLFPRLVEESQIRRRLVLASGHQMVVGAQEIVLLADDDMTVVLGANGLAPDRSVL